MRTNWIRRKQTVVPLGAPGPLKVDEEAEAVRDCVSDTPVVDDQSDHDMEIPSASSSLPGERVKVQKMDDDPVPMPKTKASRTDDKVNQVEEMGRCVTTMKACFLKVLKMMQWPWTPKMNTSLVRVE